MKRLFFFAIFAIALVGIIIYARGYRIDVTKKTMTSTGILAVSSNPSAAKIYVNGTLKGVTNLNLTLPPAKYTIEVKREGYTDWKKEVTLKGEVVMSLDAMLFANNPSLSPVTNLGVLKAMPVNQTDKILLFAQNNNVEKDGIYIFDSSKKPLSFFPPLKAVVLKKQLPTGVDISNSSVLFSPDFRQAIFSFPVEEKTYSYLVSLDDSNDQLLEVTSSKETLLDAWTADRNRQIAKIIEIFPKDLKKIASDSMHIVSFSPDETKVLYKAKAVATLPQIITPPLIGANQSTEARTLEIGKYYVYDKKEDKNFPVAVPEATPSVTPTVMLKKTVTPTPKVEADSEEVTINWYYDSKHFVIQQPKEIVVIDYDGSNKRTVYSGMFDHQFFAVNTEGRLYVLTNLNPQNNQYGDIYEIGIR